MRAVRADVRSNHFRAAFCEGGGPFLGRERHVLFTEGVREGGSRMGNLWGGMEERAMPVLMKYVEYKSFLIESHLFIGFEIRKSTVFSKAKTTSR